MTETGVTAIYLLVTEVITMYIVFIYLNCNTYTKYIGMYPVEAGAATDTGHHSTVLYNVSTVFTIIRIIHVCLLQVNLIFSCLS